MKVYLVGGAVRDEILGRPVKDRDWVVVGATPEEMLALGYKQVGADFPVFLHPETGEEYALARTERKSGSGYHGFTVSTENVSLEEDLERRDLTINSMAKDIETGEIIDPFHGRYHIDKKLLVHTSEAFQEDPLRVVRLARFGARYIDFSVRADTEALAMHMMQRGDLDDIPYERFWAEMRKALTEKDAARFFAYIFRWKGREMVQFFHDVFGSPKAPTKLEEVPYIRWFFEVVLRICDTIPEDDRMMFVTAICGRDDLLPIAGMMADSMKLHGVLQVLKKFGEQPSQRARIEVAYELMKSAKPWGEGPLYDNLITAVRIKSAFGLTPLSEHQLESLRAKLKAIKAEQFPNLEGKELGAAIEKARKLNIELTI